MRLSEKAGVLLVAAPAITSAIIAVTITIPIPVATVMIMVAFPPEVLQSANLPSFLPAIIIIASITAIE